MRTRHRRRTLDGTMCQRHIHVSHSMHVRSSELQKYISNKQAKVNISAGGGLIQVLLLLMVHCRQGMHPETGSLYEGHTMRYGSDEARADSSGP